MSQTLSLLGGAYSAWETRTEEECLSAFGSEIDNVRTALDWALAEPERAQLAIGLAGAAGLLWESLGLYSEARDYLEAALSLVNPNSLDAAVARLWLQSGIAWRYVDQPRARSLLEQSVSLSQDIDEPLILASAQARLGGVLTAVGQYEEAMRLLTTAQVVFSNTNCPISQIGCIINLGIIEMQRRNFDQAETFYRQGLSIARRVGRYSHVSTMLSFLSGLAFAKGNVEQSIGLAQQSVEILRANNSKLDLVARLTNLAVFLILGGKRSEAGGAIREALALHRRQGGAIPLSTVQAGALLLAFEGETAAAARLIGFVDHRYATTRAARQAAEQRTYFALMAMLGEKLSVEELRTFAAEGAAWIEEQAFDLLLRDSQAHSASLARSTASN